jgi:tetratricopeptide (TPR) repeat protein
MKRLINPILLLVLLGAGFAYANAQDAAPAKPADKTAKGATEDKPASSTPAADGQSAKPSSADANPFPEEESKSAAKQVEQGEAPPLPADLAGDPAAGDVPRPAAKNDTGEDDGVSSSRTRLEGLDDTDPDASRKPKPITGSEALHNPKMSSEDVAIGKMYMQSDNYRGAYIRFKEALNLNPENPDAAFGVAESARKLNQTQEAIENYKLCLDLDPDGPRAKAARKALASLSSAKAP